MFTLLSSPHLPLAALSLSGRNLGITLSLLLAAGPRPPRGAGKWVQSPEPSSSRAEVLLPAHGGAEPRRGSERDRPGSRDGSVLSERCSGSPDVGRGEARRHQQSRAVPCPPCPGPRCRVALASLAGDGAPAPFHLNTAFSCSQGESVPQSIRRMLLFLHTPPPEFF